jgi:hypothetical protein
MINTIAFACCLQSASFCIRLLPSIGLILHSPAAFNQPHFAALETRRGTSCKASSAIPRRHQAAAMVAGVPAAQLPSRTHDPWWNTIK